MLTLATFRLSAPAKQVKPGPPLAPILGQQQIKVQDFITEFNKQTFDYIEGLPLGCRVEKLPGIGKFKLKVIPPTFTLLFRSAAQYTSVISATDLYKCLVYRVQKPTPTQARMLLGSLRSCKVKIQLS